MKGKLFVAALMVGISTGAVHAQNASTTAKPTLASLDPAKIPQMIINDPGNPSVNKAKAKLIDDANVTGGKALRVEVAAKSEHAWDSNVTSTVKKPVQKGDTLLLVTWAKLVQGENGATTATLPWNSLGTTVAPWSPVFGSSADIGPEWKQIEISGKADKDYKPSDLSISFQLGNAKQTVDFGPILLLDVGQTP
jgi:hypothetical protein